MEIELNQSLSALFQCCFGDCRLLAYQIAACEVGKIWQKPIGACKIQCQTASRWLIDLQWYHQDMKLDCFTFHSATLSTHENPYMCSTMWNVEHSLEMVSINIYKPTQMNKRRKVWKKITGLKLKMKPKMKLNQSQNQ